MRSKLFPPMPSTRIRRVAVTVVLVFLSIPTLADAPAAARLEQLKGQVVLVDFWASWCTPCRRSFPWLGQMQRKYEDAGLVVVGVNVDRDPTLARQFLDDVPAEFEIVYDTGGGLASRFGVLGMPSSYLLNRAGEVVDTHIGFKRHKADAYEAAIVAALKEASQ